MKCSMRRVLAVNVAGVAALALGACVGSTEPASNVTNVSAQLNARGYTDDGPATWWWEYDTVRSDLGSTDDTEVCGNPPQPDRRCGPASGGSASSPVPLSVTVRGLDPSTTYYFRACGQDDNDSGPTCAQTRSFTTLPGITFDYTGAARSWTVPPGVSSVAFDVFGAQGAGAEGVGLGGEARATIPVSPGQVLQINVGGRSDSSTGGFNGGGDGGVPTSLGRPGFGGGGASDVRVSPFGLAQRIIIAGGGGGTAGEGLFPGGPGGSGGGASGADGASNPMGDAAGPGRGGTPTAGGGGGQGVAGGTNGTAGTLGGGGRGGAGHCHNPGCGGGGGGGGGRYGGGGGGGGFAGGGGGGGGSGLGPAGVVFETGVQVGNGRVVISY
jgi:hypothetical protein